MSSYLGTTQPQAAIADIIIEDVEGLQTTLDGKLGVLAKAADSDKLDGNDSAVFAKKTDYATSTTGGTIKARINGSNLYITFNGNNA